ncbi:MAG: hypothetical protein PVF33_05015 [Candidatus Latescibacterota bacterium]
MKERRGEKVGWIGGWSGGFFWVLILSVLFMIQGRWVAAVAGMVLACLAVALIFGGAPWRHPETPYWKLMLPVYGAFIVSIAWLAATYRGPEALGLNGWQAFLLLPLLTPFATVGKRRWNERETNTTGTGRNPGRRRERSTL